MKKNMGTVDQIIRIIVAIIIAILYFTSTISGMVAVVLLALGGIFILTSTVSLCPLYLIFDVNTCSVKKGE